MKRLAGVVVPIAVLVLGMAPVALAQTGGDHCPDQDHPNKVTGSTGSFTEDGVTVSWTGDPGVVTITNASALTATVVFCAKGGTSFSGDGQNSGQLTVVLDPGEVKSFTFGTAVSYLIVYSVTPGGSALGEPSGTNLTFGTASNVLPDEPPASVPVGLIGALALLVVAAALVQPVRGLIRRRTN